MRNFTIAWPKFRLMARTNCHLANGQANILGRRLLLFRVDAQAYTEDDFLSLFTDVRVPWKHSKTRPFSSVFKYLGLIWNIPCRTVEIPQTKMDEVLQLVDTFLQPRMQVKAKAVLRLHGKLVWSASVVRLARPF